MCFKPKEVSKKTLILDLEKQRGSLESENLKLTKEKDVLKTENAKLLKEKEALSQLRITYESSLQKKTLQTAHILSKCNEISSVVTEYLEQLGYKQQPKSSSTKVLVTCVDESAVDAKAIDLEYAQINNAPRDMCDDNSTVEVAVEAKLEVSVSKLERKQQEFLHAFDSVVKELEAARAANGELQAQLEKSKAQMAAAEASAKSQHDALEVRCAALENENSGLHGEML